ncbi:hypothetical protein QTJ16_005078 [Diplocarpon rosae]|uniref:Uncharacterized protein n=1 Tax=Diplocarpon rosae TaxID=946125 RepID=A0AAD9SY77_9HELO|nr:hypothetical protein QTJ16_005078 [Diplocarpon rosae]
MATMISSTEVLGGRLLREIATEDGSLEDLLKDLRTACDPNPPRTGISALDSLWKTQGGRLSITGRTLPLLHQILTHLVSPHHLNGTVALLDLTGRFSPSHLVPALSAQDLGHVHVFRPTAANLQATLDSVEKYMLYGEHGSQAREWLGTIVNGGVGGDINLGWRGWLRVKREEVGDFGRGVSVEEVWDERFRRQEIVDGKGWRAEGSEGGTFLWR